MITREEFNHHLSHALANLFDYLQLAHNPLYHYLPEEEQTGTADPGRALQRAVKNGIEALRPDSSIALNALPWRTYNLLQMRYVEGRFIKEIMNNLQLGDRQLRRENQRAVAALGSILWEEWCITVRGLATVEPQKEPPRRFSTTSMVINLPDAFESILNTMQRMLGPNWQNIELRLPEDLPQVQSDRVLLRQMFITAFHRCLVDGQDNHVTVTAALEEGKVRLQIQSPGTALPWDDEEFHNLQEFFTQVNNSLYFNDGCAVLEMPVAETFKIMMIDDDDAIIHLFRRYLTGLPYTIFSTQDSKQAVALAEQIRPDLILLDVLLPDIDGWEVLQQLKHNEILGGAPVIICSAWNEPEIAISLGASGFLRKNVLREELLDTIQAALHLRD